MTPLNLSRQFLPALAFSLCAGAAFAQIPDFARDVLPIFETSCTICHGAELQEGQLRLDSEAAVMQGGVFGRVVAPGDSDASPLVRRLLGKDEPQMPMGGDPLSPEELSVIRAWIGSLSPSAIEDRASTHWAFVKPVVPELPTVENPDWSRNPIDLFVLAALEKEGLTPSPEAATETLIRRLSLDLIGLPPTLEELDAFLTDESLEAYDTLVERLLSSPHYGERWARPWLDLARYADTQRLREGRPANDLEVSRLGDRCAQPGHVVPPVHHRTNRR